MLCQMMKWNHLPVEGGIYAQHPKFLDDMQLVNQIDVTNQKREQEKQRRQMKAKRK